MDIPAGNALTDPYTGVDRPARLSLARPHHRLARARPARHARQDRRRGHAGRRLRRHRRRRPTSPSTSETVVYSGPAEWSYRRIILHYAHLAEAAGGVDAFLIGTELRGLTTVRDSASTYPFVAALVDLAADVKSVVAASGTKVTYAADWSEYFGHQPADGSGDVHFHLDPLWSSAAIDAVGIDNYRPLSDWRDGNAHADRLAGAASIYDLAYLAGNIVGGEGFDWYYASPADRAGQVRTPITDGAFGKPWVFRFKDIRSWWLNPHFDRPGGVEVRHAHRLGAAVQADLVHRARLPRRRPRRQPAQRLHRPQERPVRSSPTSRTASATTSCSAATCRPSTTASIRRMPATSPAPTRSPPSTASA